MSLGSLLSILDLDSRIMVVRENGILVGNFNVKELRLINLTTKNKIESKYFQYVKGLEVRKIRNYHNGVHAGLEIVLENDKFIERDFKRLARMLEAQEED